jgi:tetratricopeptide (TPR) repeat protein
MPTAAMPKPTAFRLFCSRRTRLCIGLAAVVLLASAVLVAFGFAGTTIGPVLGWTLVGFAVVLTALVTRTRLPGDECALCGRPRLDLRLLVAAPHVSVCDGCSASALAAVAEQLENAGKPGDWLRLSVEALPPKCPLEISRPLLDAMVAASAEPASLRQVATACTRLNHDVLAAELLQRIPETQRTAGDWLNLGVALGKQAREADALAATAKALEHDDGNLRPWCLNNAVWFGCRLDPHPSDENTARWLADLEEARRLLSEQHRPGWESTVQSCYGTEAEVHNASGDDPKALQALSAAEKLGPLGGERLLIRARVLAHAGLPLRAREEAERALRELHPQSRSAEEARRLLATLQQPVSSLRDAHGGPAVGGHVELV